MFHIGGCTFGLPLVATAILFLNRTCFYSLVLPLAALGLLQGWAGALPMALMSGNFLQRPWSILRLQGLVARCRRTLHTVLMDHYAGALPACSVIDGVTGRSPDFVPSPKRDRLLGWI